YTGTLIPTTEPPPTTEEPTEEITEAPEEIPEETGAETEDGEPEPTEKNGFNWRVLLLAAMICLLLAGTLGVIYYFKYIRKKQSRIEVSVYNLVGEDYILLGAEPLDADEEITDIAVDLSKYAESAESTSFGLVLNKHSLEVMNGKTFIVTFNGETLLHMINKTDDSGEYRFKLVFGGGA
ncbi:MAG: hypothetical protein FWD23_19100, partial [Oscillospiraceae bacterium]|nr:hypothetical protein [Oscillospiraceae bacterium]